MKNKKTALFHSLISLLLCASMLVGTTFAWFTDTVQTGINTIASGVLDVELYHTNAAVKDEQVNETTKLFKDLNGTDILWEPGVVSYENLTVSNAGDLALSYQMTIETANENYIVSSNGAKYGLSQILKVGFVEGGITATDRADVVDSVEDGNWINLSAFLQNGSLLPGTETDTIGIVIYWEPNDDYDNLYNLNNGKSLNEGDVLNIDLGIKLVASQEIYEEDSFGNNYDVLAGFNRGKIDIAISSPVAVSEDGTTTAQAVTLGNASVGVSAEIPEGAVLADDTANLTFSVKTMEADESQANITLSKGETATSLDVHVEGLSEENTAPVKVTLSSVAPVGLYDSNITLYHVENGETVLMTAVASLDELDAHNEYYYDAETGVVTLMMASFSEVYVAYKLGNPWDGSANYDWYQNHTEGDDYILGSAADLQGFAKIVAGEADGIAQDDFYGEIVRLDANIDMNGASATDENGKLRFYPIGVSVSGDADTVSPFKGTFDGGIYNSDGEVTGGYTISNIYQNTWMLNGHYSEGYYNEAMGLFGLIDGGTVKNLVIYGMKAEGEFTDMGCITAYARGNCKFENIRISDVSMYCYNCRTAGIVGYDWIGDGPSEYAFTDIEIDPTCTFGALWGSWDVACAGIMGYMNDTSSAKFTNCNVGPVLDVYNDVCGNYQYYQYRYSGMMIGTVGKDGDPTDMPGTISFKDCTVCYGDWSNYYYCEFEKNSMASYSDDYQFSRVSKDEIVFNSDGTTSCTHTHTANEDKQAVLIPFRQLYTGYGWGAGVVAKFEEDGVNNREAIYTIAYVNNGKVLDVTYVYDNSSDYVIAESEEYNNMIDLANASMAALGYTDIAFDHWINAGSNEVKTIPAKNTTNYVLYPSFTSLYTAIFVDQSGNLLDYMMFTTSQKDDLVAKADATKSKVPETDELTFDYWAVQSTDENGNDTVKSFDEYVGDGTQLPEGNITIYPVYTYNGDVNLIPIDSDGDGVTNYYQVGGYSDPNGQALVEIPDYVNGVPVYEINKDAFSGYAGVHSIVIPSTVESIGANAFADGGRWNGETITIYFEGTKEQWDARTTTEGWDNGIGKESRVFFMKDGKVDITQGYLEVTSYSNYVPTWTSEVQSITQEMIDLYKGYCDCEEETDGDTGHIYVRVNDDGTETIMSHNADGTPVNEQNVEIYWGVIVEGWLGSLGEEQGLRDDDTEDTYKRYRADRIYWEGVTV